MDCRFGVVRVLECLSDPQSYRLGTKGRPGRATLDGRVNAFTNAILWSSRMGGGGGVGLLGQQPYPIKTRMLQKLNSLIRLLAWLDDDDDGRYHHHDRYHHHHHDDHHLRVGQVHLGFSSNEYLFLALAIHPDTMTTTDLDFADQNL